MIVDLVGWIGSIQILLAYFLISTHRVTSMNVFYVLLNVAGSSCLLYNTLHYKTYPLATLNLIWFCIGLYALYRMIKR